MRTQDQEKIDEVQRKAFEKSYNEAHNSPREMKMHEISQLHAESLLNIGDVKVYGLTPSAYVLIPSISEITKFEQYFID